MYREPKAAFTYTMTPDALVILDQDLGGMSAKNDMEAVLEHIKYIEGKPLPKIIVYRDSEDVFDGVRYDSKNAYFYSLNAKTAEDAINKAKEKS